MHKLDKKKIFPPRSTTEDDAAKEGGRGQMNGLHFLPDATHLAHPGSMAPDLFQDQREEHSKTSRLFKQKWQQFAAQPIRERPGQEEEVVEAGRGQERGPIPGERPCSVENGPFPFS